PPPQTPIRTATRARPHRPPPPPEIPARALPARSRLRNGFCRLGVRPTSELWDLALFEPRRLPFESPQMIELRAPRLARPHHVDPVDHLRVQRKDALHSIAEADLAHRDGLPHPGVMPRDHRPFKGLQSLFVALFDFDVHANRVARAKLGNIGAFLLVYKLCQQRVSHLPKSFSILQSRSGRNLPVFSIAASRRQRR